MNADDFRLSVWYYEYPNGWRPAESVDRNDQVQFQMPHKSKYKLVITSKRNLDAEVEIRVDGRFVKSYQIGPFTSLDTNESMDLTFESKNNRSINDILEIRIKPIIPYTFGLIRRKQKDSYIVIQTTLILPDKISNKN